LVAIGTSLPELAASLSAALIGSTEIIIGTVIGSNISNIALILPLGILIGKEIIAEKKIFETDLFFMFLITILLFYFSLDGFISPMEGIIFLVLFIFYIFYLFKLKIEFENLFHFPSYLKRFYNIGTLLLNLKIYTSIVKHGLNPKTYTQLIKEDPDGFEEEFGRRIKKGERKEFMEEYKEEVFQRIIKNFYLFFIGGIAIWLGSELTIKGAVGISEVLGVSEGVIGLTLIAVGTSFPELSVSITSIKKGFKSIFLGNIIGSSIVNILLILGISSLLVPLTFVVSNFTFALIFLIIVTVALIMVVYGDWKITKPESIVLILLYLIFLFSTLKLLI